MKRLKAFGAATAMTLALAAFAGASMASAAEFLNDWGGTTTVNGEVSGENHVIGLTGEQVTCSTSSMSGTVEGAPVSAFQLTPQLSGCSWKGLQNLSWSINGCQFRFVAGSGNGFSGRVSIVNCTSPMTISASGCKLSIGNQSDIGVVEYENKQFGSGPGVTGIVFKAWLNSLQYSRSGCSPGSFGGSYKGEWAVKGSKAGVPTPIHIDTWDPHTFAGNEAPFTIKGSKYTAKAAFNFPLGGNVSCTEHKLSGEAPNVFNEAITLTPSYSGCQYLGQFVPLNTGGCKYVFHANNGLTDIVGETCAANPITVSAFGCTMTIGPQNGLPGLTFTTQGAGWSKSVLIGGEVKTLTYTASSGCTVINKPAGTYTDGQFRGTDLLTGNHNLWID